MGRKADAKRQATVRHKPIAQQRVSDVVIQPTVMHKIDWAIFAAACLLILWLNLVLYRHSGAFWRDEVSSIMLAKAPSWSAMWNTLEADSFPALFVSALRLWILSGAGGTDAGIRLFGVLVGIGIPVAAFFCCHAFSPRPPLLAIALLAVCPTVLYFGSSIRAYGLAAIIAMLCFAAFWKLIQHPTRRNATAAFVLAVLNANVSYQNSYLLFGIGVAGAVTCVLNRAWKRAAFILAICFFAGCSLLFYLPTIVKYRDFSEITISELDLTTIVGNLTSAFGGDHRELLLSWILLLFAAAAATVFAAFRRHSLQSTLHPQLYILLTLMVAGVTGYSFIKYNGIFPYPWHYLPFIAMLAVGLDVNLGLSSDNQWAWLGRIAAASLILTIGFFPALATTNIRRTNADFACDRIAENATSHDLILAAPHYISPAVNYYYHGAGEWTTLPAIPVEDRDRNSPFSAVKKVMSEPNSIEPTLQLIRQTLKDGHRVWIVGIHAIRRVVAAPPAIPPAPSTPYGWNQGFYEFVWGRHVDYVLQTYAVQIFSVSVPTHNCRISPLENLTVYCIEGWRGP